MFRVIFLILLLFALVGCQKDNDGYIMKFYFDKSDVLSLEVNELPASLPCIIDSRSDYSIISIAAEDLKKIQNLRIIFNSKKYGKVEHIENAILATRIVRVKFEGGKITISSQSVGYY